MSEEEILKFWQKERIFEKTLKKPSPRGNFVFYEGPPTANGKPGIHHVLARAFKDLIPRYKTMQGYNVARKAGWDTHGLPVELEVEKEIGAKNKKDIESYGIEKFNQQCKASVFRYKEEWERMTKRIAFWLDLEHPYVTYDNNYIESLWWIIKQIYQNNLLYKDLKVVPWCPRCGTALSSHELALGYKEVEDTSIYVKLKIKELQNTYFLIWTTTPWSLPGNLAIAKAPNTTYVKVKRNGEFLVLAKKRLSVLQGDYKIIKAHKNINTLLNIKGETHYESPYKFFKPETKSHFVREAPFVSTQEGTGLVHIAPMLGEDDFNFGKQHNLPSTPLFNEAGEYLDTVSDKRFRGVFVKKADPLIINDLKDRNLLYKEEKILHEYPFCWRCDTLVIYLARPSWFIKMQKLRDKLIANNEKINWIPDHIKHGRFGEWLFKVKDWAISRERYWGTPLPIWVCEKCGEITVVGTIKDLPKTKKLDLHRPSIDKVVLKCKKCGSNSYRTSEVIDCWFDSGAMPYAQYHYPFENKELIDKGHTYPADYICEAVDQTRGWFYTLLAIATLLEKCKILKNGAPYKNVISLGHILDKKGQKMSKSRGNIVDPWEMINKYGVDTIRWYFYTVNPPGEPIKFDERTLLDTKRKTFLTLANVVSFYKMYTLKQVPGSSPALPRHLPGTCPAIMDRWILTNLNSLVQSVTENLDEYKITEAARGLESFIMNLSQWYIRRSRERIKYGDDKEAIYILKLTLNTLSKLMAPFAPFTAESMYKNTGGKKQSVHLEEWPKANKKHTNPILLEEMDSARKIVEIGHALRAQKNIKVRQPLETLEIRLPKKFTNKDILQIIADELNVKEVKIARALTKSSDWISKDNIIALNIKISKELEEEGILRELIRQINAQRKERHLTIKDQVDIIYHTESQRLDKIIRKFNKDLIKSVLARRLHKAEIEHGFEIKIGDEIIQLKFK